MNWYNSVQFNNLQSLDLTDKVQTLFIFEEIKYFSGSSRGDIFREIE